MDAACKVRVTGSLAPYSEAFEAELMGAGYAPRSAQTHLLLMRRLSRWLDREGIAVAALSAEELVRFLADGRERGARFPKSRKGAEPLVAFLRRRAVIPGESTTVLDAADALIEQFRLYLASERALGAGTIINYVHTARLFLRSRTVVIPDGLKALTASDVQAFIVAESTRRSVSSTKCQVTGMRSLLRFFHVAALTDWSLVGAVPTVQAGSAAWLPRAVDPALVQSLLAACDRQSWQGSRNYAVLILLSRLGLRVAEVAAVELGDVDWRNGELLVRGKAARLERLPLPSDVGDALAAYVQHGRALGADPAALFVSSVAPHHRLTSSAVIQIVHSSCRRAGIDPIRAHRLRHTIATALLAAGAGLPEIGQLLRHRSMASTAIYTSVDIVALRELARPWPGGAR